VTRLLLFGFLIICTPGVATAELWQHNSPLHHALVADHDAEVVVAGKIVAVTSRREFQFHVRDVILGARTFLGRTLTIRNGVLWPKSLVPYQAGECCILVLRVSEGRFWDEYGLRTVVAGRDREYAQAADELAARAILAEELVAQLQREKAPLRQRELLLQLAPILSQEASQAVEGLVASADPWVRRAALAALVYATEDPQTMKLAAQDIEAFLDQNRGKESTDGPGSMRQVTPPKSLLLNDYFFLNPRSWNEGAWNEAEVERHLRILDGVLNCRVIEAANQETLFGKLPPRDEKGALQIIRQ